MRLSYLQFLLIITLLVFNSIAKSKSTDTISQYREATLKISILLTPGLGTEIRIHKNLTFYNEFRIL